MATTNLTNTKWVWNDEVDLDMPTDTYGIEILAGSAGTFYTYIVLDTDDDAIYYGNNIGSTRVVNRGAWVASEDLKTIEITGGDDVTNTDFIAYLEANATQVFSTVDIKLGNNTLLGVDTIVLTDATDTSNKINFSYGVTPSGTVSVKLWDNTLTNVNTLSVLGNDSTYKSFGYAAQLGGTISLRGIGNSDPSADSYYSYIKINEAPATAQDYDYMVTGRGYVNSKTQTQITQPVVIEGASVAYLWCDYNANFTCQYKVDNGSYQNLTPFSSPTTLTLTNDIELTLTGWKD